jgi:hypothetical protein
VRDSDERIGWVDHEVWRADLKASDDKGVRQGTLVQANANAIALADALPLEVKGYPI